MKKTIGKKILAGTIAATFVLGIGYVGSLHNQAFAETASASTTTTDTKAGAADFKNGRGHGKGFGMNLRAEAATALGIEEDALKEALQADGATLLTVAEANGLTEDEFLEKLTAAATASIDEAVTAGTITEEQAEKQKSNLSDQLKQMIEKAGFGGDRGGFGKMGGQGGPGGGRGGYNLLAETATVLGIEEDALKEALQADGATLVSVAEANGLTEDAYLEKLTAAVTSSINKAVEEGTLTEEQAAKQTENLSDRLKEQIERAGFGRSFEGHGGPGGFGGFGRWMNNDELAQVLGMTADELKTAQADGQSLVEIAKGKGISEEDLISAIKDSLTDDITKYVEATHQRPQKPEADASSASE